MFATGVVATGVALLMTSTAVAGSMNIGVTLSRAEHLLLVKVRDAMQQQSDSVTFP